MITLEHTNTKNKKSRRIPINFVLRKLFLELRLQSSGRDHVFLNSEGEAYKKHDSLNRAWSLAKEKAKIKVLRFHDLRHAAATRMVERGVNIVAVNKILGHADLKTTKRYAHPGDSLKDAVETLAFSESNGHEFGHGKESQ